MPILPFFGKSLNIIPVNITSYTVYYVERYKGVIKQGTCDLMFSIIMILVLISGGMY